MNDDELKRTITVEENIEETPVPDNFTFKRTIISENEDSTVLSDKLENAVYKTSKIKIFFAENPALTAITLISAFALITAFFFIGCYGKANRDVIEKKYADLRENDKKYNALLSDIEAIGTEIDTLTLDRDRMQSEADTLKEYDARSDEIDTQLASLQAEIESINSDSNAKKEELDKLTGSISTKTSSIVNLPSGIYTVGENITAGKYLATGSGKILVSTSNGGVKLNTILTADGTEITLDNDDKIQLDTRAKFTPIQTEQGGEQQ
ncbi:MAG: hypothetical protein Q4G33_07040 [bacterium]|nr:hypothetical protein [bacterium]